MADTMTLIESNSRFLSDKEIRIASGGLSLAAKLTVLSHAAPVVILAHGFAGDMNEQGLFVEARDFFAGAGFSVLRFDFRGCGKSDGDFRDARLSELATDLLNVIKYARSSDEMKPTSVGLVGFSLGAGIAVLANSRQVSAYAFWSPAIFTIRDMSPRYQTSEIDAQITRQGWFAKAGLRVGKHFLEDLNSKKIEGSLAHFRHPALVAHGRDDQRIPYASSRDLVAHLPISSKLILIPGADHSFRSQSTYREWLFSATTVWLRKRFWRPSTTGNQAPLFQDETKSATPSNQSS